jgi:hypothetical protein
VDPMLKEKARKAIWSGKLPALRPDRTTLKGTGSGATCGACDEPLTPNEREIEIEVRRPEPTPGLEVYGLHAKCFEAWEFECRKVRSVST